MLFLASGRSLPYLRSFACSLGVRFHMLAAENGGHIEVGALEVLPQPSPDMAAFAAEVGQLKLPPNEVELKISVWTRHFGSRAAEAGALVAGLVAKKGLGLSVVTHPDGAVDVWPVSQDKSRALDYLPSSVLPVSYFGDNVNDLEIMRNPRVNPHTLSNGAAAVKSLVRARAGRISTLPYSRGVIELIDALFLPAISSECSSRA